MEWDDCLVKLVVKKAFIDKGLAKSCIDMAERVLEGVKMMTLNDRTAPVITSNLYDALLNVCEALLALNSYKSYNHECITSFLSKIINETKASEIFDRYRKMRNNIRYYGRTVTTETAKKALDEIIDIINHLKEKYFKQLV